MKSYISTHIFIPQTVIPDIEEARSCLTVRNNYDGSDVPAFCETKTHFGIPLHFPLGEFPISLHGLAPLEDRRTDGEKVKWEHTTKLRPNQNEIFDEFVSCLNKGKTSFIFEAACGYGKTTVMLAMLAKLGRKALVVVNKSDLVEQWVERMCGDENSHTNLRRDQIGIMIAGKCDDSKGKLIFVALVHTLNLNRFPKELIKEFGVVVFDEVDRSVPPATFAPVLGLFPAKYRISASATIKRADGLHKIFEYHCGQHILRGGDEGRMAPTVITHKYHKSSGRIYGNSKMARRGVLISKLSTNKERNELIVSYILAGLRANRRICVVSDRTEQLLILHTSLVLEHAIPAEKIGFYSSTVQMPNGKTRTVNKKEQQQTIETCQVILSTYGLMKVGTDIPDLEVLIYGTPQSDIIQVKGRIERMCKDKKSPIIIDIIDSHYAETRGGSQNRLRQYRKGNLKIKEY